MKIVLFENISKEDWNEVASSSLDSWFFHYYEWIMIESDYFTKQNLSFAIESNDKTIAIFPLYLRAINRGWVETLIDSGHHRQSGIAFVKRVSLEDKNNAISMAMEYIFFLMKKLNAHRILLNRHNLAISNQEKVPFWIEKYGFHSGMMFCENGELSCPGMSSVCADQIVDLLNSKETLFDNTEGSFRRAVRKATKSGVSLFEVDNSIEKYYDLAVLSANRTGEQLLSKDYYLRLYSNFILHNKVKILFAQKDGELVSALFLILDKKGANFFGGVSHPDYLQYRVNDFIHWEAILWAKNNGFLKYRLGPIFPSLPQEWNICKVSKFKKKLGGNSYEIMQGCYYDNYALYLDDAKKNSEKLSKQMEQNNINFKALKLDLQIILKSYGYLSSLENISEEELFKYKDMVEKIIKFKQGDASKVTENVDKTKHGFDFERPFYLYESLIDKNNPTKPNADILGFELAYKMSKLNNIPLIEVLPYGAQGLIILTGDDDQAFLEKYDEQLKVIKNFPITYFLHPLTKHTTETISKLSPEHVDFGIHPDALEEPFKYDTLAKEQLKSIENLVGYKMNSVRNHGFLSDGYQGHLKTWEDLGLEIDVNIPGVDGTALNGSYLPMKVKKEDGRWSEHYSLITAFGDGMLFAQNLTESQCTKKINKLANQIEKTFPGVLVFNFHPQNISSTTKMHKAVLKIAKRKNWIALTMKQYLDWLKILDSIQIERVNEEYMLKTNLNKEIEGVVLNFEAMSSGGLLNNFFNNHRVIVPKWTKSYKVKK